MNEQQRTGFALRAAGSCLVFLLLAVPAWMLSMRYLGGLPEGPRMVFGGLATFLFALGAFSFWGLITGGGNSGFTREKLVKRAMKGERPRDGEPIISSGKVAATGGVLHAPFSGTPCASYFYRIYFWTNQLSSRIEESKVALYWGYASQPFNLESARGRHRVVAVPQLRIDPVTIDDPQHVLIRKWISATHFEPAGDTAVGSLASALSMGKVMLTDDTGSVRKNWHLDLARPEIKELFAEEILLPIGEEATVVGTWSESRASIISGDAMKGVVGVSAFRGGFDAVADDAVANRSITTYIFTALFLLLAGAGIIVLGRFAFKQ